MSHTAKGSRRKEIRAKEELQAQFQLAIANTNKTVVSWLPPSAGDNAAAAATAATANSDFFNLPIVPTGVSLASMGQTAKVGDFLHEPTAVQATRTKGAGHNDKAMAALRNSLRNQSRQAHARNAGVAKPTNVRQNLRQTLKPQTPQPAPHDEDEDEDEDIAALKSRSLHKSTAAHQFGKKRPF